jgi:hypothetical protein
VDFGEEYGKGLKGHASNSNSPWKFLIVDNSDILFFLVGPVAEYPYHANLLDAFCADRSIPAHWEHKPDLLRLDTGDYTVCGGGWVQYDANEKRLIISGRSTAYGQYDSDQVRGMIDPLALSGLHEVVVK